MSLHLLRSRLRSHPFLVLTILIAAWLLFDRGLAMAMRHMLLGSDYRISRLYAGTIDADVLIVGNSRAAHLADVRKLGALTCSKVFNLATNGQDAGTEGALVKDYFDHNRPPRLMIVELSNLRLGERSVVQEFLPFMPFSERLQQLLIAEGKWGPAERVFHLYAFNSTTWWRALVTWFVPVDQQDLPYYGRLKQKDAESTTLDYEWVVDGKKIETVVAGMRHAEDRGVEVVGTLAPYHLSAFGGDAGLRSRYVSAVYAGLPEGVSVLDLSSDLAGREYFADRVHINRDGLEAVQPRLVELIRSKTSAPCAAGGS